MFPDRIEARKYIRQLPNQRPSSFIPRVKFSLQLGPTVTFGVENGFDESATDCNERECQRCFEALF